MPVTTYYSANGGLLGESDSSGSRLDYLSDALGSVAGTVTSTATTTAQLGNRYRYKPYGTQYVKTGTAPDPLFTWVGSQGYRQTARQFSDVYVRARHYSTGQGRWTTKDPIGYVEGMNQYRYCKNNPVTCADVSGLAEWIRVYREYVPHWIHAYLRLNGMKNCIGGQHTFGLWPGDVIPQQRGGTIESEDELAVSTEKRLRRETYKWNGSDSFEARLCDCINADRGDLFIPRDSRYGVTIYRWESKHFIWDLMGTNCDIWTGDIWECARQMEQRGLYGERIAESILTALSRNANR
jgi:RHS repeat-associated protein